MRAAWRLILAVGLALTLEACLIEAPRRGHLEVWNRTTTPIGVVGREASFQVPACGHVVREDFLLNRYDIVDAQGRFIAWHGGGTADPSHVTPAYEMVTSEGAIYSDSKPPPEPLPPCEGVVVGQQE